MSDLLKNSDEFVRKALSRLAPDADEMTIRKAAVKAAESIPIMFGRLAAADIERYLNEGLKESNSPSPS